MEGHHPFRDLSWNVGTRTPVKRQSGKLTTDVDILGLHFSLFNLVSWKNETWKYISRCSNVGLFNASSDTVTPNRSFSFFLWDLENLKKISFFLSNIIKNGIWRGGSPCMKWKMRAIQSLLMREPLSLHLEKSRQRGDNHGQMLSLTVTKIMAVSAFYYYGMKQKWKHQKIADVPRDESFKYKSVNYAHLTVISEIIIR